MTDLDRTKEMLDRANHPHFEYTQVGEGGNYTIMVLDGKHDGGREVSLMYFDLDTKNFVKAGTRWFDP